MSQNANYKKYYQTALKKFTKLSNSTSTSHKSDHKTNKKKIAPVIEELISNYSFSSPSLSSSSFLTPPSQTFQKKKFDSIQSNSSNNEIDWPDENDGWVYIKNLDDDEFDHETLNEIPQRTCIFSQAIAKIPIVAFKPSNVTSTSVSSRLYIMVDL
ncbi:2069_t:CDS:2 [Acaulospora morrowiae]|uniref:2069_t:CDS:1 n=1 Tax=Acaulospora morrowiae TaxID=94023 RepID=A0A9N9FAY5_9GLOM|nr:2069_t:CDS:2 [Acaulospora morrowiae]